MTVDEPGADRTPGQPDPTALRTVSRQAVSEAALERYRGRMRRGRLVYFAVIAVVVLALGVTVGLVWSRGEAAHTTLHTAARPAPTVPLRAPAATVKLQWQSRDKTAIGTPYWGGTVVTYSADSVRGRNGLTGAITWSYTRTDRTVCQAVQDQGVTLAVFELHGNCDEVTALDSASGARKWTRTLDKDHQPLNGHPAYSLDPFAVMFTTATVIYTIDPASGLDRWVYQPTGCTINRAVIGVQGALISQTCAHPKCAGLTFCGRGKQLLLRDANTGRSDDAKDKANPDQIKWNLIGNSAVPASADQLISAVDPGAGQLVILTGPKGKTLARLALHSTASPTGPVAAVATDRAEVLWIGGTAYAVTITGADLLWATPTPGVPTVTQSSGTVASPPVLNSSTVAAIGSGGIDLLNPVTGRPTQTVPISPLPQGSRPYLFGTGFVLAATSTAVYQ